MSEKYTPKVGDKVRATLGENVVVGEVIDSALGRVQIEWPGREPYAVVDENEGWHIEQVVSVPSKFGAVIRRADGVKFALVHPDPAERVWMRANDEDSYVDNEATAGGFTVLFDGVDE